MTATPTERDLRRLRGIREAYNRGGVVVPTETLYEWAVRGDPDDVARALSWLDMYAARLSVHLAWVTADQGEKLAIRLIVASNGMDGRDRYEAAAEISRGDWDRARANTRATLVELGALESGPTS